MKSGNFIASNRGEKLNDKENEIIGNKKWNKALKVKDGLISQKSKFNFKVKIKGNNLN